MTTALEEGLALLKFATQHDNFQRYHEASFVYNMAVESLSHAADEEPNQAKKEIILRKIEQYRNRAVYLSQLPTLPTVSASAPVQNVNSKTQQVSNAVNRSGDPNSRTYADIEDVNSSFEKLQEILEIIESAKRMQSEGGNQKLKAAAEAYERSIELLTQLLNAESVPQTRSELKQKIYSVTNSLEHLKVQLSAKSKFTESAYIEYMKADTLVEKAKEQDDLLKLPDAIRLYEAANVHFKIAFQSETDLMSKKIIAKRMHLCNKRVEQLTYYHSGTRRNLPVKFGNRPGESYQAESPASEPSFWGKVSGLFSGSTPTRSSSSSVVVGTMIEDHPETSGEWLISVKMKDAKTMTDPVDSTTYTVYVMSVSTNIMKDGVLIDNPKWDVIRRYRQFRLFYAKLQSINATGLAEFPPDHKLGNVMQANVVHERLRGFQRFFDSILAQPANSELNDVCLRFLRNTFRRQET